MAQPRGPLNVLLKLRSTPRASLAACGNLFRTQGPGSQKPLQGAALRSPSTLHGGGGGGGGGGKEKEGEGGGGRERGGQVGGEEGARGANPRPPSPPQTGCWAGGHPALGGGQGRLQKG